MGKRLTDDIINLYCNKLQDSTNRGVYGMLAMQYILVSLNLTKFFLVNRNVSGGLKFPASLNSCL